MTGPVGCRNHHCRHLDIRLGEFEKTIERMLMAAIDDLTGAVSALAEEVATFLADVAAQVSGGVTADEAEAVVSQIQGFTAQLQGADPANQPPAS